ncbi:MAG: DUF484 family protein [Methylococcaceae bacterium]|nr:DUF484 family protein [Methylococcaceae bacterium]
MKLHNAQATKRGEIPAEEIEEWLRRHPDFFQQHLDLLEILKLPHPCGEAVSLISRQIELLREKNRRLQQQLSDILHVARDNDILLRRYHRLTLALQDASCLDDALASLRWLLQDCFQADFVAVRLIQPIIDSPIGDLCVAEDSPQLPYFWQILEIGQPECGKPERELARFLFGAQAHEVQSHALVPLQHAGLTGILAIGSRDPKRFEAGMGSLFLSQMSEMVAARFVSLLPERVRG